MATATGECAQGGKLPQAFQEEGQQGRGYPQQGQTGGYRLEQVGHGEGLIEGNSHLGAKSGVRHDLDEVWAFAIGYGVIFSLAFSVSAPLADPFYYFQF